MCLLLSLKIHGTLRIMPESHEKAQHPMFLYLFLRSSHKNPDLYKLILFDTAHFYLVFQNQSVQEINSVKLTA